MLIDEKARGGTAQRKEGLVTERKLRELALGRNTWDKQFKGRNGLFWLMDRGLNPQLLGPVASGPALRQHCMVEGTTHFTAAKVGKGTRQRPDTPFMGKRPVT